MRLTRASCNGSPSPSSLSLLPHGLEERCSGDTLGWNLGKGPELPQLPLAHDGEACCKNIWKQGCYSLLKVWNQFDSLKSLVWIIAVRSVLQTIKPKTGSAKVTGDTLVYRRRYLADSCMSDPYVTGLFWKRSGVPRTLLCRASFLTSALLSPFIIEICTQF